MPAVAVKREDSGEGHREQEVTDRTRRGNGHEGKEDGRRSFQGAQCG